MKSPKKSQHKYPGLECPHCGGKATCRTSKPISRVFRELYYRCPNDACDFQFVATLEVSRTLRPSLAPNPEVHVPFSDHVLPPKPANDDTPFKLPNPANDTTMSETG